MPSGLLWDNDGVLVDTERLYFRSSVEALERLGIALSREDFIRISLTQGRSVFELAGERGVDRGTVEATRQWRNRRYGELLATEDVVVPGVRETLERLAGRIRMAVVTGSRRDHFEIVHARTGLLGFFELVLTHDEYVRSKPHPEPYLRALELLGLEAADCVVVEDSERGVRAAAAAGIDVLALPSELTAGGDFAQARAVLRSIEEVPDLVLPGL